MAVMQSKTVQQEDYQNISSAVELVEQSIAALSSKGIRIDIPHPHRIWEYASAVAAFNVNKVLAPSSQHTEVLDVGSGYGALGPALAWGDLAWVTEFDFDENMLVERQKLSQVLRVHNLPTVNFISGKHVTLESLVEQRPSAFDAVFCISVLEHTSPEEEKRIWANLAKLVKTRGLIFVTVDVVDDPGKAHHYDELRTQKFTVETMRSRKPFLQSLGLEYFVDPDYTYHGNMVHDYSFMRMVLEKK